MIIIYNDSLCRALFFLGVWLSRKSSLKVVGYSLVVLPHVDVSLGKALYPLIAYQSAHWCMKLCTYLCACDGHIFSHTRSVTSQLNTIYILSFCFHIQYISLNVAQKCRFCLFLHVWEH